MRPSTLRSLTLAGVLALACFSASCTDPVKDAAIARLGEENGAGPGPEHRPGQPCVLCHSEGGTANLKLAIGGTVFQSTAPNSDGANNVEVLFIDASSAQRSTTTNAAGNFYITVDEWPDLTFPFKVGLLVDKTKPVPMVSTVNREGSCNFCHKPNTGSPLAIPGEDPRESIGQIYVGAAPGGT